MWKHLQFSSSSREQTSWKLGSPRACCLSVFLCRTINKQDLKFVLIWLVYIQKSFMRETVGLCCVGSRPLKSAVNSPGYEHCFLVWMWFYVASIHPGLWVVLKKKKEEKKKICICISIAEFQTNKLCKACLNMHVLYNHRCKQKWGLRRVESLRTFVTQSLIWGFPQALKWSSRELFTAASWLAA